MTQSDADLGCRDVAREVLTQIGDWLIDKAVRGCIVRLRRMPAQLTGSGLRHAWDEICVQVQGEESIAWNPFQDMVHDTLRHLVSKWPDVHLRVLWLRTDSGQDWLSDEPTGPVPVDIMEVVGMLERELCKAAADATNRWIEEFNQREHD
jgi:hypothetical protein